MAPRRNMYAAAIYVVRLQAGEIKEEDRLQTKGDDVGCTAMTPKKNLHAALDTISLHPGQTKEKECLDPEGGNHEPHVPSPQATDPKEAKRQRERDRYAGMSAEQKIDRIKKQRVSNMSDEKRVELNRKHRESYKRRKAQSAGVENVRPASTPIIKCTYPGVTRGANELGALRTEENNVMPLSGVTQDIPGPRELTFAGDLTPNETVGTRDIPGLGELTFANNGITPNESGGSQETIFGTDNPENRVVEKVSLRTTQSMDRSHEETRCDPQPTKESAAHHAGSTNNTHDAVDEMQPGMVEDVDWLTGAPPPPPPHPDGVFHLAGGTQVALALRLARHLLPGRQRVVAGCGSHGNVVAFSPLSVHAAGGRGDTLYQRHDFLGTPWPADLAVRGGPTSSPAGRPLAGRRCCSAAASGWTHSAVSSGSPDRSTASTAAASSTCHSCLLTPGPWTGSRCSSCLTSRDGAPSTPCQSSSRTRARRHLRAMVDAVTALPGVLRDAVPKKRVLATVKPPKFKVSYEATTAGSTRLYRGWGPTCPSPGTRRTCEARWRRSMIRAGRRS
ncbi:hypothetical protein C2845_PM18G09980 [Panicum miliaceum]|uniref:Uncharacterized protein n=1 Tax=Panicum miliaceum TaxID=4540 RepID=A0A3L6PK02_PANMI|nr:hypothetical protein C2845_PM18G09980 [Panicum miliaceum]